MSTKDKLVHVAPWRMGSGDLYFAVVFPYDAEFITLLKSAIQPRADRSWIDSLHIWLVALKHKHQLRSVLHGYWIPKEFCPSCEAGVPCSRWREVSARGLAESKGSLYTPPPDPPRPPLRSRPPPLQLTAEGRAALVLGITLPTTKEGAQVAFRQKALLAHPDHGGSHEGFLALRRAYELILGAL